MIVKDEHNKPHTADAFKRCLADVREDDLPLQVMIVRSSAGGEWFSGDFEGVRKHFCIKQEFTTAKCAELNGVSETGLGVI